MDDLSSVPEWLSVSRETLEKLDIFCRLVVKWNPAVNLVSKSTIPNIWQRHMLDSAQLFTLSPVDACQWLDIGSGAGFPGVVVSILSVELKQDLKVTLVEADRRKAVFLAEAIRILDLPAVVICQRAETLKPQDADIVSARAVTSLDGLCHHAHKHLKRKGLAIFPKGVAAAAEIEEARNNWRFTIDIKSSKTDPSASILLLKDITSA